jgi:Spx/MgsR family transcriptional regulator
MLKIYGIKNCDSVKKAIKHLKEFEIPYKFIDFRETAVSEDIVKKWLEHTNIKTLFNTRSTTYRTLKLKELNLDDKSKQLWLVKENMLIKRPVITFGNEIIVGYNKEKYLKQIPKIKDNHG